MRVEDYHFNDFYHGYITIEADALTEKLKDKINITEEDCYALCSSYCDSNGDIMFNVLSVGPTWEKCTKGIDLEECLGIFSFVEVCKCEARIAIESDEMLRKNGLFLEQVENDVDEDLMALRCDQRLDDIRAYDNADHILVGVLLDDTIEEVEAEIISEEGPFVMASLWNDIGDYKAGDKIYALPYVYDEGIRLLALFIGDTLTPDEEKTKEKIFEISNTYGLTFSGISIRS